MKVSKEERISRIKEAVSTLTENRSVASITMYDVACAAHMSASSIYNYYPSVEAILCDVLDDIFPHFFNVIDEVSRDESLLTWQEVNRSLEQNFARCCENNQLALKVLYSHHQYLSVKEKEFFNDIELGNRIYKLYNDKFYLPVLPEDKNIFTLALQASDKIYFAYHDESGKMNKNNVDEAIILTESYLGYYLSQYLKLKK